MKWNNPYFRQVQLLVAVLPLVAKESCFALKGGTAINLFVRDLPRLSVDIDLVYVPFDDREQALRTVREALTRIALDVEAHIQGSTTIRSYNHSNALRLIVAREDLRIKIELSPVLRGTIHTPELRTVRQKVESVFGYAELPVLSFAELFAGKICAALDRQHPRDLFDIKLLLENEGFGEDLRKAFLVYLISHPRPIAEVLCPTSKDIRHVFEAEFAQMTEIPIQIEELEATRDRLVTAIHESLSEDEKQFLISFKARTPNWSLLGINGVERLPAVKWKLLNLERMSKEKHRKALQTLEKVLSAIQRDLMS